MDKLATPPRRTSFDDLPDTEPGEELGTMPRPRRQRAADPADAKTPKPDNE